MSVSKSLAGLALVIFGLSGCAAPGAEIEQVTPEIAAEPVIETAAATHFSVEGITALEARMAQFVEDGDTVGIATRLVHNGEVISDMHTGLRRQSDNAPITEDTIYRIYSMSKPITGAAMMMLYEEGAFSLDDPITDFIPEFEGLMVLGPDDELVPAERAPTMRELMSHTAGFAYGLVGDDPANTAFREGRVLYSPDLQTFIDAVAEIPLLTQPGEKWAYSASVDIQGAIIERISGQSFGAFLEERIFQPLGMVDTGFGVGPLKRNRFSHVFSYDQYSGTLERVQSPAVAFRRNSRFMQSGGGGLVSTMDDYARFAQMLLNRGELDGERLLQPETVDLMATNVLPDGQFIFSDGTYGASMNGVQFGLNVGVYTGPPATDRGFGTGTYFWGGAAGTWFWIDPVNDLYFIGMIQRFSRGGAAVDFRGTSADYVYQALEKHDE